MYVESVLETCLYVDDLEKAESFYECILGLACIAKEPGRHISYRCGEATVLLFIPVETELGGEVPAHGARGPGHVAFAIREDEIDAWREHLKCNGVHVEKEVLWPRGGSSLYFRDPAGNSLEVATPQIWGLAFP